MTEFALLVPVLMVLIMGVFDGALLMFSVGTARYGSAEGSRVAATLGNVANTDSQVVATVRNIVSGTQLFTVDEVDIYKLNRDGNDNLTQDVSKTNKYALDGTPLNGTPWPVTTLLRDIQDRVHHANQAAHDDGPAARSAVRDLEGQIGNQLTQIQQQGDFSGNAAAQLTETLHAVQSGQTEQSGQSGNSNTDQP